MKELSIFTSLVFSFLFFFSAAGEGGSKCDMILFQSDQGEQYVQIYAVLASDSINFEKKQDKIQAKLTALIHISSGGQVIFTDSFTVSSPLLYVKRNLQVGRQYILPPNSIYQITMEVYQESGTFTAHFNETIELGKDITTFPLSDPLLLANVVKVDYEGAMIRNGFQVEPLYGVNKRSEKNFMVYLESYVNDQKYLEDHFIQISVLNERGEEKQTFVTKMSDNGEGSFFIDVETAQLESGQYELRCELKRYSDGEIIKSNLLSFYRDNPYLTMNLDSIDYYLEIDFVGGLDEEEVKYCLRSVVPIVPQAMSQEWLQVSKNGGLEEKRKLLMKYYVFMDHNLYFQNFVRHMKKIDYANAVYKSGFGYGFESDRGVIYLKYGRPNGVLLEEHESTAPPYEIWSYNALEATGQTNVKFIFYNPSLAVGNYILLHSTAKGEINNPRWKLDLYKNSPWDHNSNDINETGVKRTFTRRAGKNFDDF